MQILNTSSRQDVAMTQSQPNTFARVGMSHVTRRLGQPYETRMAKLDGVHINTSSQPNANPHFGTLTTLMCVAAVAEEMSDHFGKPVQITFDQLENAPDRKVQGLKTRIVKGQEIEYQISLQDSILSSGTSLVQENMKTFKSLFDFFEQETGVPFRVRSYHECQADPLFRTSLLKVLNDIEHFGPIVSPSGEAIRLRFPCPTCKWVDKGSVYTRVIEQAEDEILFEAFCPDHGEHQARLAVDSDDFFDTNTPLRDIAKVPGLIEAARQDKLMPMMIDGRDWSGRWDRCVHVPGVSRLGYDASELPARVYSPVVTDTLGAKLSKSLYVGSMYSEMPRGFADFNDFMEVYGESGLQTLWEHVREWSRDPAYMDRDSYTITYFMLLLGGKLGPANIMG